MPIKSVIRKSQKNGETPSEEKKPKMSKQLQTTKNPEMRKKREKSEIQKSRKR